MSLIETGTFEIFYANRPVIFVEENARREGVEFYRLIVRILPLRFKQALPRAYPRMIARRERRIVDAEWILDHEPPIVGITLAENKPQEALDRGGQRLDLASN